MSYAVEATEAWTVSCGEDIYSDARRFNGVWFYRDSPDNVFLPFPVQSKVVPICTNPSRSTNRA